MCDLGMNPEHFNPRIFYVIRRKFDVASHVSYHVHDYISLIYILSGSCTYKINNELYPVKKGDIVLCNPGIFHGKILNAGETIDEFHTGFTDICIKNLSKNHLIADTACPVISPLKYEQDFFKCCSEMLLEQKKNEPGCELLLKSLFMKLIVILLKETYYNENMEEQNAFNFETYDKINIVNTIVTFINENYMKEVSLDKISRNMYLSAVYISKIFKEETGEPPINYLIRIRLSKARDLLEESTLTIKEVAKQVGYDDAYHFSKLFKKYYGYPPSKLKGNLHKSQ